MLGDEAYRLKHYLMRPYPERVLNNERKCFNIRLSIARQTIECAFGILTTTCILHNVIMDLNGDLDLDVQHVLSNPPSYENRHRNRGVNNNPSRRAKNVQYWVHPILRDRLTHGMFVTLYPKLREHEPKMSIKSFDDLLDVIKVDITGESTILRESISPEEKLVITLRYLATGCSFADLHYGYRLGKSTIIKIVEQSGLSMSHMAGRFWISSINKSVSKCSVSIFGEICVHSTQKRAFKCTTKWRLIKGEFAAILSRVLRATVASTRCVPTREHLGRNSVRNMELNEAVSLWLAYRRWKRQKRRENRMYLVHPILNDRMTHSMFETLYPKLRQHEKKFFNYFRMSVKSFDDLLLLIEEDLSPRANYVPREDVVSAEQKLVITLRLKIRFNQRHGFGRVQDIHYPENLLMMLTENLRIMMPVKISALKYNCVLAMLLWMAFLGHILDKKIHLVLKVVHGIEPELRLKMKPNC
ncbi:hypothetical protein HW555_013331 [Spodoptera exigua]|uniref:DDE Tnp4 domain-containing protein n=1 Tax=Spodoptera exigua TaxID=7107 RepID=A0A835G498_SPOEX|nr:hypothetical protein HW555_013331 [Spodoptera exigua]